MQAIAQALRQYVAELQALMTGRLSRARLTQMQAVLEQLADVVQQANELVLHGRLSLEGDLWPEVDEDYDEETDAMDQQERDFLMSCRDALEDAGVSRQARGDAMARLERQFQGRIPEKYEIVDYVQVELRRQAPHFWSQGTPGTPPTPAPTAREARKGAAPVDVRLTEEEQQKKPEERLTLFRQREAAARGQQR